MELVASIAGWIVRAGTVVVVEEAELSCKMEEEEWVVGIVRAGEEKRAGPACAMAERVVMFR